MIVDERGRLFGKINLIDLAILLFVVVLVPVAYGAYVLFRTPPPRVTSITPNSVVFAKGVTQRLRVNGEYLRPFLRARLGGSEIQGFQVDTTNSAELRFVDLLPGTYDLVLFDESQEVSRFPAALKILPSPVQVVGEFEIPASERSKLTSGLKFGTDAQSIAELVDATTIRATCELGANRTCTIGGTAVAPGVKLRLPVPRSAEPLTFLVKQLRIDAPWARVHVRLMGFTEALAKVHAGDAEERGGAPPEWDVKDMVIRAQIESTGQLLKNQGTFSVVASLPQPPVTNLSAYGVLSSSMPVDALEAVMLVPLEASNDGQMYRGSPVRPGAVLNFETPAYRLQAAIVTVEKP